MAYAEIPTSLIGAAKANTLTLWQYIRDNFSSHQSRLNTVESTFVVIPTGMVICYPSSVAPDGFLECDGSAVSRTAYSTLFGEIGTAYGDGDGVNTFNVPDLRGRAVVGSGTGSGLSARTCGTALGNETHDLSAAELPTHTHVASNTSHTHGAATANSIAGLAGTKLGTNAATTNYNTTTEVTGITLQNTGSGSGHDNVQPLRVAAFMIKT